MAEDNDFQTFVLRGEADNEEPQQWRVVSEVQIIYSEENGNEPETLCILQPVLSGFDMVQPDAPKPFAVLEDEFYDILIAVEG